VNEIKRDEEASEADDRVSTLREKEGSLPLRVHG
jgi:hypothetical protein